MRILMSHDRTHVVVSELGILCSGRCSPDVTTIAALPHTE